MKILVVVDYQNDFISGALGFEGADNIDKCIAEKVRKFAAENDTNIVLGTLDTHSADYLTTREGIALPVEHCLEGTQGYEVYGETAKALKEVNATMLKKATFGISPEQMILLGDGIGSDKVESIELVGLVTNMCVISNAVVFQARYPWAQIIVDASLCDSFDKVLHNKALDVMEGMQIKVINR